MQGSLSGKPSSILSGLYGAGVPAGKRGDGHSPKLVRDVRNALSHAGDIPPQFEYELLKIYAKNELLAALVLPFFMVVIALAMMNWVYHPLMLFWLVFSLMTNGLLIHASQSFLRVPRREVDIRKWKTRFLVWEFLHSASWALLAVLTFNMEADIVHIFVSLVLFINMFFRVVFANSSVPLFLAGTIPVMLAIVIPFLVKASPFYSAMACMIAGLYLLIAFVMRNHNEMIMNMLFYRTEKDRLITDLEESNAILETARFRAEQASLSKTRFLANMSHELRTPLNAIIGFSEVMKDEMLGVHTVDSYKGYSSDIHGSGTHLLSLIDQILDLSRIETGHYDLVEEEICLCTMGEEAHHLLEMRASRKGVTFEKTCEGRLARLVADRKAVRQIYLNLLSNALKFTPRGGQVTLAIRSLEDGSQSVSVKDNGPGIPEDEMFRVLTPFGQGAEARNNLEGGAGLGLPIVQELVKLHGGSFALSSREREGTEVVVTFPALRVCEDANLATRKKRGG